MLERITVAERASCTYDSIVAGFGEQVKAQSFLHTTCTPTTLLRVGATDEYLDEPGELAPLIESRDPR